MRANEFLNETQELDEIERLTRTDYVGGKDSLYDKQYGKQVNKLPGGSGLMYSTSEGRWGGIDIKLWDPNGKEYLAFKARNNQPQPERRPREPKRDYEYRLWDWQRTQRDLNAPGQLIGKLSVSHANGFPLKGAVQVDTITVDEDYRGVGLAKALYGIVLTIMKRPLLAGSSQTPGGRRNWVSLASIPGVEMKGYIRLEDDELEANPRYTDQRQVRQAEKNIDIIMGKLGGQHIGSSRDGTEFFSFDVRPNTTGKELEAYVKTNLSKVYIGYDSDDYNTGLYAVWAG
jgi:GNAT superfamily N-acetyltransferase